MSTHIDLVPDPIAEALFGRTRRRVLALLYGHPDRSFHLREVVRETGTGVGAVQRELDRLSRAGLVIRKPQGQQVHFSAETASPVFQELAGLLEKTGGVQAVLRSELARLQRKRLVDLAFIYGSLASGKQKVTSDIDLMIIGTIKLERLLPVLRKLQANLGREVNPSIFARAEFAQKYASHNHFVRRVTDGRKIMLVGTEDDLKGLVGQSMAHGA